MPKYLLQGSYSAEGARGLLKDGGTGRRAAVKEALQSIGGKVDSMYYAFGETDVFVIVDVPDSVSAAAAALVVNAAGSVHLKTTVLLTPEEMDEAASKSFKYRAPGQ